jgi:hypothetical protein
MSTWPSLREKQIFKARELIKKKYDVDWEKEQRLQQFFVKTIKTIQKMQA